MRDRLRSDVELEKAANVNRNDRIAVKVGRSYNGSIEEIENAMFPWLKARRKCLRQVRSD